MPQTTHGKVWAAFIGAAVIWSTSFLWIKVGLEEASPLGLVFYRLVMASAASWILFGRRVRFPRFSWNFVGRLFLLSLVTPVFPFLLITWGETQIDSGVASVLNGTVPIFAVAIAAAFLPDEPFTLPKVLGILGGFVGLLILFSNNPSVLNFSGAFWGQLAVVGGAVSYGISTVFTRRWLREVNPAGQTCLLMTGSMLMIGAVALYKGGGDLKVPTHLTTWLAIFWLGVFGTGLAYSLYFFVVEQWGAARASMLNYLLPPLGLFWGVVIMNESFEWRLLAGMLVVAGSILIVNRR